MTFFGIIWFLLLFYCMSKGTKYMVAITMFGMVFQCNNVIIIGSLGVGPQVITSFAFVIFTIFTKKFKFYLPLKSRFTHFVLLMLSVIVFISSILNNVLFSNIMVCCQLLIYFLCIICLYTQCIRFTEEEVYLLIRKIVLFCVIIGFIQILVTSNIIPRIGILKLLIYNDNHGSVYFHRNNYYRVLSTFMEPSYYSAMVVGAFYYFISLKSKRKENIFLIILLGIQTFLTFSSTAYGALLVIGVFFISFAKEGKSKLFIIIAGLLICFVLYYSFYDVLDKVIFSKGLSGSAIKRNGMNSRALTAFYESPIYGHGYKQFRASSIVNCLLAELGILGLIAYLILIFQLCKPIFQLRKKIIYSEQTISISYAVLTGFVTQIIACPDLDLCTLWFWIYFVAIYDVISKVSASKEQVKKEFSF